MPDVLGLYNPPVAGITDLKKVARLTDKWCMTPGAEREAACEEMLGENDKIEFHGYLLNSGAHLPKAGKPTNRNHILWNEGETAEFLKQYPEAPLRYLESGEIVMKNALRDYVVFDISYDAWRQKMTERVAVLKKRAPFLKGIWWDDLGVEHRANDVGVIKTEQYPTREKFIPALLSWLAYGSAKVAAPAGLRFGGNLQAPTKYFGDFQKAANIMVADNGFGPGVVLIEWGWFTKGGDLTPDNWLNTFQKGQHVIKAGGELWTVMQLDPRTLQDTQTDHYDRFYLALLSQMLIDERGRTAIRVAKDYDVFDDVPAIRGIDTILGKPKGEVYQDGSWYVRKFEHQTVKVNPSTFKYEMIETPPVITPPVPEPETPALVTFEDITITIKKLTFDPALVHQSLVNLLNSATVKVEN